MSLVEMKRAVSGPVRLCFRSSGSFKRENVKRTLSGNLPKRSITKSISISRLMLTATSDLEKLKKQLKVPLIDDGADDDDLNNSDNESTCSVSSSSTAAIEARRDSKLGSIKFLAKDFVQERQESCTSSYQLGQMLGEGAFGEVFLGLDRASGVERALKVFSKGKLDPREYKEIRHEYEILKSLDHPNIITVSSFFESDTEFCICMDICHGGELYDEVVKFGQLSEKDAAVVMSTILSTLNYLHERQVVHRDLNLENILLESGGDFGKLKLIDFGLATRLQQPNDRLTEIAGKIHYVAPEVFQQSYGTKYDIWQCGIIAFILLAGHAPFDGDRDEDIRFQIMGGTFSFDDPSWECVSEQGKAFVELLLSYDEEQRPTAEEALHLPWMEDAIEASSERFRRRSSTSAACALKNMLSFSATSKLKELLLSFIASQLIEKEEKEETDIIFQVMDTDHDGRLSSAELKSGYRQFCDDDLSEEELGQAFDRIDLDASGFIEYSEFVMASIEMSCLLSGARLKAAFQLFDKDGNGFISTESLKQNLSASLDDETLNSIICQVDDGVGQISFDKFKTIMLGTTG